MWKYYYDNIGTNNVVAEFFSGYDLIFSVYEDKECYKASSHYKFISSYSLNYSDIEISGNEDLEKRLQEGCKMLEKSLYDDISQMKKIINRIEGEKEEFKVDIILSSSVEKADAVIEKKLGKVSYAEKIKFLEQEFNCRVLDRESTDSDEMIYFMMLDSII